MKRLLPIVLLVLCTCVPALAQNVTVSGNVATIIGTTPPGTTFVRMRLRNYTGFVPRVNGVAVLNQSACPGASICFDFIPVAGVVSGVIYGNDQITPSGTYYTGEFWVNGRIAFSCDYLITGSAFNFNTASCLSQATPVGPNQLITQSFICSNFTPSSAWTCTHNFNDVNVDVAVYTLAGVRIFPDTLTTTSPNVVTITWFTPTSGIAVIIHAGSISIATNQPNAVLQNPTGAQSICCQPFTLLPSTAFTTNGVGIHNGVNTFNAAMNAVAGGSLVGTFAGPTTLGALTVTAGLTANNVTDSALTVGNCVQAGTAGLLTTAAAPCSSGGGGGGSVTTFSYSESGLDSLLSSVVTNSTTTPNLAQTAAPIPAGTFFAGPVPTGSATNPTFENSSVANGNSTFVSVTGVPAAASSVAIYFAETANSQPISTPSGWSDFPVAVPGTSSTPHFKNLSSTAPITPSSTITSSTWATSLEFLGGTITSIPQNATFSNCATGCISGSLGAVTAGHTILVIGYWGGSVFVPDDVRISDNVGNGYLLASFAPSPTSPTHGHFVFIAQNVLAGTPTITIQTSKAMNFSGAVAYDLAGPGPYYTGPNGPWTPRRITAADLGNAGIQTVQAFSSATLGSDVPVSANTPTTLTALTQTVKMPAVGCPCRADVRYGIYYTFPSGTLVLNAWVSDGSNVMASSGADQIGNGSGFGLNASQISSGTYGSGSTVTFTLLTKGNNGYTVSAAPVNSGGPSNSWFEVAVVTSN